MPKTAETSWDYRLSLNSVSKIPSFHGTISNTSPGHDVYITFENTDQYGAAKEAITSWEKVWKKKAQAEGSLLPFQYANNGNTDSTPLTGYGKKNLDFIKKTAKKYDPLGIMQKLQNDGFLIRKV